MIWPPSNRRDSLDRTSFRWLNPVQTTIREAQWARITFSALRPAREASFALSTPWAHTPFSGFWAASPPRFTVDQRANQDILRRSWQVFAVLSWGTALHEVRACSGWGRPRPNCPCFQTRSLTSDTHGHVPDLAKCECVGNACVC